VKSVTALIAAGAKVNAQDSENIRGQKMIWADTLTGITKLLILKIG
jgi:hypothetical protein